MHVLASDNSQVHLFNKPLFSGLKSKFLFKFKSTINFHHIFHRIHNFITIHFIHFSNETTPIHATLRPICLMGHATHIGHFALYKCRRTIGISAAQDAMYKWNNSCLINMFLFVVELFNCLQRLNNVMLVFGLLFKTYFQLYIFL